MKPAVLRANWRRVLVSGVVWALVYNLVWGIAWLTFMRRKWLAATASRQSMPWAAIWIVWGALSILLGLASMAYVRNRAVDTRGGVQAALAAAGVVWVPLTAGMVIWAWQASVSSRVAWLDSFVNFLALLAASVIGGKLAVLDLSPQRRDT